VPLKINQALCTRAIGKMFLECLGNWPDIAHLRIKYVKVLTHLKDCFQEKAPGCPVYIGLPKEVLCSAQLLRDSKCLATAWAGERPGHHQHNADFCIHTECKSCRIMKASTQNWEENPGNQAMCSRVRSPANSPWEGDAWSCETED
jgi:hypothetical protein